MNLRASSHALLLLMALGSGAGMLRALTNQWTSLGPYDGSVTALAIDPQNPAIVYAGTYSGIFKTTDGAASWRMINNGLPISNYFTITGIVVNPQNASTLYAWGTGNTGFRNGLLLKSTDGASSWSTVWSPPMAPPGFNPADGFISSMAMAIDPQTPEEHIPQRGSFCKQPKPPVAREDGR